MTYEPPKGYGIYESVKRAIENAINIDDRITLLFNGLEITVFPESCLNDIVEKFLLQNQIRRLKCGYED